MKISLVFPVANSTTPPKLLGMFFTTPSPTLFVSANSARLNKSDLDEVQEILSPIPLLL